jgi:hypothetical protein
MVGTARRHVEVWRNMVVTLDLALRGKPCRVYHHDVKVRAETVDADYDPDVLVTCSPKDLSAEQVA